MAGTHTFTQEFWGCDSGRDTAHSSSIARFDRNVAMQVSGTSAFSGRFSGAGGDAGDIAKLQKQLRDLVEELKGLATSNIDAKSKKERIKLLQSQIQMVQAQISAIQRARQQEQQKLAIQKSENAAKLTEPQKPRAASKSDKPGSLVDTYA